MLLFKIFPVESKYHGYTYHHAFKKQMNKLYFNRWEMFIATFSPCTIVLFLLSHRILGFPGSSDGKETACSAGDLGSIPGVGRSPGEGNGDPLQYSGLENPTDRGAWRVAVSGVPESPIGLSD